MSIVQKNVGLSEQNVEDFHKYYPRGNLSAILDMLLEKFNAQHRATPEEYAEIAAKELFEETRG